MELKMPTPSQPRPAERPSQLQTPQTPPKPTGPYFEGQAPSECGHYFPDVLRLREEPRDDGNYVRIVYCEHCGVHEVELPAGFKPRPIPQEIKIEEVHAVREAEMQRLATRFSEPGGLILAMKNKSSIGVRKNGK